MSEIFGNIILFLDGGVAVNLISLVIIVMFVVSLLPFINRNYQTELVALGILGTFIGIAIGLYGFDSSNVKDSIPVFLDGLKTAFITSALGLFFSVLLGILKKDDEPVVEKLDVVIEKQDDIIQALKESLQEISQSASTEMIESIQKVFDRFNQEVNDQLGESFKELNNSIVQLNTWQSEYKNHVQNQQEAINQLMNTITSLTNLNQKQLEEINKILDGLSEASSRVVGRLDESTKIVEESLSLLIREANGKI